MQIKDLEILSDALNTLIEKAKKDKKGIELIELEKTAFYKYQRYIAGTISFKKNKLSGYGRTCPEKIQLEEELKQYIFISDTLKNFIEAELQDERSKINLY